MKTWEGLGEISYADKSRYQGFTLKQKYHGKGRLTYANGDVYQGDWVAGKPEGNGVFVSLADQTVYDGGWLGGRKHGRARETRHSGQHTTTFDGNFEEGKLNGAGKVTSTDP